MEMEERERERGKVRWKVKKLMGGREEMRMKERDKSWCRTKNK